MPLNFLGELIAAEGLLAHIHRLVVAQDVDVHHRRAEFADKDGEFIDYQYQKKMAISRTLRRHFLNHSADSPFEAEDKTETSRRPPHSPAPDPLYYFGAESVFVGLATLGITGGFVPIPIESLTATFMGNWDEFGRGFTEGADAEAQTPPTVGHFKVKNR